MKRSVRRWLWGFSVLLLVSLLPFFSCPGAEPRYTMTEGEMGQFMNLLEKQRAWQKKQKEESLELEKELKASERALEKAMSESKRLSEELETLQEQQRREKETWQTVKTSFESYRKEEERTKRRLKRQRTLAWAAAVAAGIMGAAK